MLVIENYYNGITCFVCKDKIKNIKKKTFKVISQSGPAETGILRDYHPGAKAIISLKAENFYRYVSCSLFVLV